MESSIGTIVSWTGWRQRKMMLHSQRSQNKYQSPDEFVRFFLIRQALLARSSSAPCPFLSDRVPPLGTGGILTWLLRLSLAQKEPTCTNGMELTWIGRSWHYLPIIPPWLGLLIPHSTVKKSMALALAHQHGASLIQSTMLIVMGSMWHARQCEDVA